MYAGAPCLCVWAIGDVVTSPRWREGGFFGRRARAWRNHTRRRRRGGRGAAALDRSLQTSRSSRTRPPTQHPRCRVARPGLIRGGGRSRRRCGTQSPRQSKHPRRRRSLSNPAESSSPRRRRSSSRHRTRRTGAASTHSLSRQCPNRIRDPLELARQKFELLRVGCSQPCILLRQTYQCASVLRSACVLHSHTVMTPKHWTMLRHRMLIRARWMRGHV